jgi:hypothetical protein
MCKICGSDLAGTIQDRSDNGCLRDWNKMTPFFDPIHDKALAEWVYVNDVMRVWQMEVGCLGGWRYVGGFW